MKAILFDRNGNIDQQVDFDWPQDAKPPGAIVRNRSIFVLYGETIGANRYHQVDVYDMNKKQPKLQANATTEVG